jgi:hypothetical protein
MITPEIFESMVGTTRTERRMIRPGEFVELRYEVAGVKHKGASRFTDASVTVFGRCVDSPEGSVNAYGNTWQGTYCAEVFYADPAPEPETDPRYVELWDVELLTMGERASAACGMTMEERARGKQNLAKAKAKLYALLDALSDEELRGYAKYRRSMRSV